MGPTCGWRSETRPSSGRRELRIGRARREWRDGAHGRQRPPTALASHRLGVSPGGAVLVARCCGPLSVEPHLRLLLFHQRPYVRYTLGDKISLTRSQFTIEQSVDYCFGDQSSAKRSYHLGNYV